MSECNTITIPIGTKNIEESNRFLRKLWGLLDTVQRNAWQYTPHTYPENGIVFIGSNNVGTFLFDYHKKGCINNLYIENPKIERTIIEEIVKKSMEDCVEEDFFVEYIFKHDNRIQMSYQCHDGICIYESEGYTRIIIRIAAFSILDLEFWTLQKRVAIQDLLFVYTKQSFQLEKWVYSKSAIFEESMFLDYDYEWYDADECPKNKEDKYYLPIEFFNIINEISTETFFSPFVTAMINASQMIHNAYALHYLQYNRHKDSIYNIGFMDLFNAGLVSSLEAIISVDEIVPERCDSCGQLKYAISKRVYDLVDKYIGQPIANEVKKRIYNNRSKYLHEGKPITPLYYCGYCFPIIDPRNPREMLQAETHFEYNLVDYCMYIVRKVIKDHYDEYPQKKY